MSADEKQRYQAPAHPDTIREMLKAIPRTRFRGREVVTPWGVMHEVNQEFVNAKLAELRRKHPGHDFRVIICHDEPRSYTAITIDNPDPRDEEEMRKHGEWDNDGYYTRRAQAALDLRGLRGIRVFGCTER